MDARRFDAFARALSASSRRGLLGTLLALPMLGGLLAVLGVDEAAAKGRRKRRKKRHKHGKGNGRHRKGQRNRKCRKKSRARICAGKCGIVKNKQTCKKKVDCGSCACDPPCPVCQVCQAGPSTPGTCVPDPAQVGEACGAPGQFCQTNGVCACDANSCRAGQFCADGVCRLCLVGSCEPGNTSDCQYATLQEAIDDPAGPQTIELCAITYQEPATIQITRSLTLLGAGDGEDGTILDGQEQDTVVAVSSVASGVRLEELRITNGGNTSLGGGLTNGGQVAVTGCTVTDNAVVGFAGSGGGIFNDNGGEMTLSECTVSGNTAELLGGGIYNEGELILNDCTISGNSATEGGGIYNSAGTVTVDTASHVCDNEPDQCGGFTPPSGVCTEDCPG